MISSAVSKMMLMFVCCMCVLLSVQEGVHAEDHVGYSTYAEEGAGLSCDVDADCGWSMRCVHVDMEVCEIFADGSQECAVRPVGECRAEAAPCATAMDCAEGFVCEAFTTVACLDESDEDPCAEDEDEECEAALLLRGGRGAACEDVVESFCVADSIECLSDMDCPSQWSCEPTTALGGEGEVGLGFACVPDPTLPSGVDPYGYGSYGYDSYAECTIIEDEEKPRLLGCSVQSFSASGSLPGSWPWLLMVGFGVVVARRARRD